ncbi:MAG: type II toxin-antitoxin system MqsA family antitoxin [Leptospiraceae bacterium]|nr:type II toxin-antitoxin system MqsA family antitoxin [Leptospiraceae bacterium]MBK9503268.1 type II toxin-antitoxin system MqsA family antitoxin [Leptospiraceae bacterium]MBL0262884.1 type II toxin-antitoxin system MqsA family antitoxin [Leptospiraceae bacterium]MBP9163920.1 type II toxin-antitoxin system MqsA family antitoxin [Leptospiraceae bacterium]HRG45740.1 type II toxin-antitoxin system MqsA family antitoxin [Leptospiraceae bacterium]
MSKKMKEAIVENLQDIVNAGIKTTFTKKRLDELGVKIQATNINPTKIKKARKNLNLSQSIFAQLLNVSIASVRHWEQGLREPTGSTKVLLELLLKQPHILDYRITKSKRLVA